MMMIPLYLIVGALTGLLSGLLGVGGGILIVPAFVWIFSRVGIPLDLTMHFAIAGSLAIMAVTSMISSYSHYQRGNVDFAAVKKILPGMVIGVLLGSSLAAIFKTSLLEILFGILLLIISLRLFFGKDQPPVEECKVRLPHHIILLLIAILIGVCSGLLGVGGGVLIIPVLTAFGVTMHRAAGTSATLIIPVALVGALNFLIVGLHDHLSVPYSTGYLYWPAILFAMIGGLFFAPIGTALGARFKSALLKKAYAIILFIIALQFLL